MRGDVVAHAFTLGPEHQRHGSGRQGLSERGVSFTRQTNAPVSRFRQFLERAGQIHHAHPRNDFQRATRGFRHRARFRRGVTVLRDDRRGTERRGRAQDRADVVRVGHLVEHQHRPAVLADHVIEEYVLQRRAFEHQPLMRRIARDQPGEIVRIGILDGKIRRQFAVEGIDALTRRPQLAVLALGVLERRFDRVPPPQAYLSGAGAPAAASALHPPGAPAHRPFLFALGHGARPASAAIDRQALLRHGALLSARGPRRRGILMRCRSPVWTGGRVVKGSRL